MDSCQVEVEGVLQVEVEEMRQVEVVEVPLQREALEVELALLQVEVGVGH
jgi:hypothetical protein